MSDFFAAVIERVIPSRPTVSPRRQVRFDVPENREGNAPELALELAAPPARSQQRRERSQPEAPKIPVVDSKPAPPVVETNNPGPVPRQVVPAADPAVKANAHEPQVVDRRPSRPAPPSAPVVVPRTHEAISAEAPAFPVRRKSRDVPKEPSQPVAVPVSREKPASHRNEPPQPPTIVPMMQRAPREPSTSLEIDAKRNDSAERTPSPPRIEITIGTVEVRAMVAPSAPAPVHHVPRAPAPPVSLTEYLKQRGNARS